MFVDRKLEGKTEPTCGGDRPGTRESLGFQAFDGEKKAEQARGVLYKEEDSDRENLAGRRKRTGCAR
jgi:hypothetical protein